MKLSTFMVYANLLLKKFAQQTAEERNDQYSISYNEWLGMLIDVAKEEQRRFGGA